ncbi:hypothetical protein JTB14_021453 [Gonioctena quinquepunctata]|nr:hypothetical protein JTB14_021453 [Gonioctena quinquepunctata]
MLNMNKRTGNLSSAQKTELLEFLERNPALQKGKFSNGFTTKKAQGMWMEVSNTLNSLPVTHKDWRQWRKIVNGEWICLEAMVYGILSISFWVSSGYFFLDAATLWTVTPAESRQWNQNCMFLKFFDRHDVWHLLSAPALYFTFMYLMCLDDDIIDKEQSEIVVF